MQVKAKDLGLPHKADARRKIGPRRAQSLRGDGLAVFSVFSGAAAQLPRSRTSYSNE